MALQILFGDDEHTAADGPYPRVMKTRKWLYLTSVAALLVGDGWIDYEALSRLLGNVVDFSTALLAPALSLALLYLSLQYLFLVSQLFGSYDVVLKERFAFRRQAEVAAAEAAIVEARDRAHGLLRRAAAAHEENVRLIINEGDLSAFTRRLQGDLMARGQGDSPEVRDAIAQVVKMRESQGDLTRDPAYQSAMAALQDLENKLDQLKAEDPSRRPLYRLYERAIDGLRITPPIFFAGYALARVKEVAGWG